MLKPKKRLIIWLSLACCLFVLLFVTDIRAQGSEASAQSEFTLEEITVTAEKRMASLQSTSLSIAAVTGENIMEMGLVSLDEVLKDVPNVQVQGAARGFVIAIRGLGSDLPPGVGESSVSTNFDGVYNFRSEAGTIGYYDLERVEVLRGPQGTLYGRNATGGVVNVISKDPVDEFKGYGTVEVGTNKLLRTEGAVNVPIGKDVAARLSFININREGFVSNGTADAVGSAARAKIRFRPSGESQVVILSEYSKLGGKGPGFVEYSNYVAGDYYKSSYSENQSQDYVSYKFSANVEFSAGPGIVTFIPSYQHGEGIVWGDQGRGLSKSWDPENAVQYSTELRYASKDDSKVKWVSGLYYYNLSSSILGNGNATLKTDKTKSYAGFGQVTVPITEALRGVAGARYAYDDKSYFSTSLNPMGMENQWKAFDWKAGLEADLAEGVMAYLTLASGHRPGGFNSFPGAGVIFEPEALVSGEIGLKSRFLGNRMQVNANAFYYDYKDYQVADFYVPPGASSPVLTLSNVGSVRNYGGEVETEMLLTDYMVGKVAATYLKSEYLETFYLHGGMFDPPGALDMKGRSLPHAPEWTVKGELNHTFMLGGNGSLTPSVQVRWTDDQYVSPYPGIAQLQEAYTIYDASLNYRSSDENWSINLYAKNIGDKVTKNASFGTSVMVGNPFTAGIVFNGKF